MATFINSVEANGGTTAAMDTTSANFLAVVAGGFGGVGNVSDSETNAWSNLTIRVGGGARVRISYVLDPFVSVVHTFTLSVVSNDYIAVGAYFGVASFEAESGASGGTPGTLTPSADNALVITGLCAFGGSGYSASGGFTVRQTNNARGAYADLIQTSAAAANPTWSGQTGDAASAMAVFLSSVAAGGNPWNAYAQQQRHRQPDFELTPSGLMLPRRTVHRPGWASKQQGVICA